MRNVPLSAFAIVLCPFISSGAISPVAQTEQAEVRIEHAADLLGSLSDADSLAAAGLLSSVKDRDRSLRLIEKATAAAPDRPDLVWLQIQSCQAEPACNPQPMEERLRALDVRNAAGWMATLTRADKSNDEQAKSAALAAIGRSERMD